MKAPVRKGRTRAGRRGVGLGTRMVAVAAAAIAVLASAQTSTAHPRPTVSLTLLSVSDWHGQLDPLTTPSRGGAAVLSAYFQRERAMNPNTLTLTAGDAFGGSVPVSSFFDEVPGVKAMRMMGFDADTLGNHNFDRGLDHLRRMVDLAAAPAGEEPGAPFSFVSANLSDPDDLLSVAPYVIREIAGVKVAIVGITNPEARDLVLPGRFGSITVQDPVPAANRARAAAQAEGAKVIVAITHMGITGFDPETHQPRGPLVDFAENVGNFDVILGDHTNVQYAGIINNALVVENLSKGATYARTTLGVDPLNGRVVSKGAAFVTPLASGVTPDPAIQLTVSSYAQQLRAQYDQPLGTAQAVFARGGNVERTREVAIGNLLADAMRIRYGTRIAFTNGGGLRAPLPSSYKPADSTLRRPLPGYASGPPYDLVLGDAYAVLPFGNTAVTRTVSGAQLWSALDLSVSALPSANGRFLQVSGFRFTYDPRLAPGSRVTSVTLDDGTPVARDATTYSATLNDFVNAGGDGYTMFADGGGVTRDVLAEVFADHIRALGSIAPHLDGRIVDVTA